MMEQPLSLRAIEQLRHLYKHPLSSRWSQEPRCTRHFDDDVEHTQEHWAEGLKVQNTKVSGVDLEQPEGINVLLQEQAKAVACYPIVFGQPLRPAALR